MIFLHRCSFLSFKRKVIIFIKIAHDHFIRFKQYIKVQKSSKKKTLQVSDSQKQLSLALGLHHFKHFLYIM